MASNIQTKINPGEDVVTNALYTGRLVSFLKEQYSLFVWDTSRDAAAGSAGSLGGNAEADAYFKGLNPANPDSSAEFFFTVAPKVTELGEPFATTIVPTQRGGKFVESHGSIIKNIRIQGTTGVRPNRPLRPGATVPLIGQGVGDLAQQFRLGDARREVPATEETGFTQIMFLNNIFRAYSDVKENNEASNNFVMVFRNNKDGESWIVEPMEFRKNRSSKSPLSYEYNIVLKTLAPFRNVFNPGEDPLKAVLATQKVFSRVQEFNQSLRRTFLIVSTQIRRLEGLGVFAQTQILDPLINVTRGLGVVRATGANFGRALAVNAQVLASNLDEAIDLLSGTPGVEAQDALVRSLRRSRITASRILSEPGVRETVRDTNDRQDRYSRAYTSAGDRTDLTRLTPSTGGSRTYLGNERTSNRYVQGTVNKGEDIRGCAGRLLGDRSRWKLLATVNDLKPPYFSSDGSGNTLKPGDSILYPVLNGGLEGETINSDNTDTSETASTKQGVVGPVQQAYGRDLRLRSVPVSNSGVALTDFAINQRGDLSSIVGIPNVSQGLILKFSTEKGELLAHPSYGAKFPIGSKATITSINDFRTQTESTLLSDPRVSNISSLDFISEGDVILVQSDVELIGSGDSVDLVVPVRSL